MTDQTEFKVTSKAGAFVAGQRSPGMGGTIRLTAGQAFWPLRHGEIERAGGKPKAARRKEGKPVDETAAGPIGAPAEE